MTCSAGKRLRRNVAVPVAASASSTHFRIYRGLEPREDPSIDLPCGETKAHATASVAIAAS